MQLAFQFCPVASPLRDILSQHHISSRHHSIVPLPLPLSSVLRPFVQMDYSSRNRLPAPHTSQTSRHRAPESTPTSTTPTVGEIDGRVDQLALVQETLQNGATPTMIAGFAVIIAQMQAQAAYPDVRLTITRSNRPLERSASFRDGAWHGYDLTHDLIDPRSHMVYGEPARPPMDQERSLRISPTAMQRPPPTPCLQPNPLDSAALYR